MLEKRADPQNLPEGLTERWPGAGYSNAAVDYSGAFTERGEIYDLVRDAGITGFAIVSGDRHSFWAGYAAKALPPKAFEPVGVAFITGSISSPGHGRGARRHHARATICCVPCSWPTAPAASGRRRRSTC